MEIFSSPVYTVMLENKPKARNLTERKQTLNSEIDPKIPIFFSIQASNGTVCLRRYIEGIYFFAVNTTSSVLKISVISRVRSTIQISDILNA